MIGSAVSVVVTAVAIAMAVSVAWQFVASIAEALALTVFAACGVLLAVLVRVLRASRRPAPARARAVVHAELVRAPYRIERAPLAIDRPKRYGMSPGDVSAVTVPVVLAARDGEMVER
jgi:hypothetical protein